MLRFLSFVSSIGNEEAEEEEEHGNSVKIIEITSIKPVLHAFLDFFQISLAFNMY